MKFLGVVKDNMVVWVLMKLKISTGIFLAIMALLVGIYSWWMSALERYEAVEITAGYENETSVPVYAQFVVTQSLTLSEPARVESLAVPLLVPVGMGDLRISLVRDGGLVDSWLVNRDYFEGATGVKRASLDLDNPMWLSGVVEVVFEANSIAVADKDKAAGVFVETLDLAYPNGNYKIAENEKRGDVSLILYASETRWKIVKKRYAGQWDQMGLWVGSRILLAAVLAIIPAVEVERWQNGRRKKIIGA